MTTLTNSPTSSLAADETSIALLKRIEADGALFRVRALSWRVRRAAFAARAV